MRSRWVVRGVKIAMMAVFGVAVFGFIVMSLWNWLLPGIFGLPAIGFWQALGLLVLSKILFGGFRGGPVRRRLARPDEGALGKHDA